MAEIYLYETTAATDGVGGTTPIRLTNGNGYNHPTAPGYYLPRIASQSSGIAVQRAVFSGGKFGGGDINFGVVEAVNADGGLDAWLDYGFGKDASLKLGDEDDIYSNFTTIIQGKAGKLSASTDKFSLSWKSRMIELDLPASPATFAGTNSGTTGLEGLVADIKGQRKPRARGILKNISPVLVNAPLRIFAWNYDVSGNRVSTNTISAVRYRGAAWSFGTNHANAAALQAATPTQGIYDTCLAESLIKMGGSSPLNGAVTIDVTIEASSSDCYAANIAKAFLLDAGISTGDISASDITALNSAAPYAAGIYVRDETFRDVI